MEFAEQSGSQLLLADLAVHLAQPKHICIAFRIQHYPQPERYSKWRMMLPANHPSECTCVNPNITVILREIGSWPHTRRVTRCGTCGQINFLLDITEGHPKDYLETIGYEPIPLSPHHADWLAAWPSPSPPPDDLPAELSYFRVFWSALQCDASTPTVTLLECSSLDAWARAAVDGLLAARPDLESVLCEDIEIPGGLTYLIQNRHRLSPRILEALMGRLEDLPPAASWRAEHLCLAIEGLSASILLPRLKALAAARATAWWNLEANNDGRAQFHSMIERCIERLS